MPLEPALGQSCEHHQEHPDGERYCLIDRGGIHRRRLPFPQLRAIGQATHLHCGEAADRIHQTLAREWVALGSEQ